MVKDFVLDDLIVEIFKVKNIKNKNWKCKIEFN